MSVYEVLTVVLISLLATAATAAIYLGLLGWMGGVYVVRCTACHHLTLSATKQPTQSCAHCRHPVLLHPLYSVLHPGRPSKVKVVRDRLKY